MMSGFLVIKFRFLDLGEREKNNKQEKKKLWTSLT